MFCGALSPNQSIHTYAAELVIFLREAAGGHDTVLWCQPPLILLFLKNPRVGYDGMMRFLDVSFHGCR